MIETILFYIDSTLILIFGIILSCAFAYVRFNKKNCAEILVLFLISGIIQILTYLFFKEKVVWQLYPFITHLPIILLLCLRFKTRSITAVTSVTTAYLCCQPAKWIELLTKSISGSDELSQLMHILVLLVSGYIIIRYIASYLAEIYSKNNRSVAIFGIVPIIYYIFEYSMAIYTNYWNTNNRTVAEFLPFFLCIIYMVFCVVYYKEEELKAKAERNEQIMRIASEQQEKEITAIKRSEKEIRLLRHDMRLLLNNLALCIENSDKETALKMISGYTSQIDATSVKRYCANDTINYIISNYAHKCEELQIDFEIKASVGNISIDEIILSSIFSNALDNAVNAQKELPLSQRKIIAMIKETDDKLLLSVKNPYATEPIFIDGLPISTRAGHGYGTQSIRYMTEQLGGICEFTIKDNYFAVRIII